MSIVILVVGGIKGGAGKSTVSANLAARRAADEYQVLLVDGDDQQTTTLWAATRREQHLGPDGLTCIQLRGKAARTEVQRLAPNYRDVIVDVGGRDTTTQRAALTIADVVLLPIPPRGPDVWTLDQVASLLDEVRTVNPELRALAFLNRADPQGKDNADAETIIRETAGIELIEPRFGDRKAFPSAHVQGLAVFEAKPRDVKASAELDQLYRYLFDIK